MASEEGPSRQTAEFDDFLKTMPATLAELSAKIGGDCAILGDALTKMFAFNRRVVQLSSSHKKPTPEVVKALAAELVALGAPIKEVEKNFKSQFGNHAKAAHESVAAFQWVLADNGGLGLVEAAKEAVDFWANKVRKDSKDKTLPEWMAWANALRDSLNGLYAFVKEHYKQGITYNGKGGDFPAPGAAAPAAAAPAPAAAAPVAAAPAPAAAAPATNGASTPAAGGARPNLASMFSQISSIDQSSGRTAGLKHVDKKAVAAEKAAGAPVTPAAPTPKPVAAAPARRGEGVIPSGEQKVECENGLRWKVDYVTNNKASPLHLSEVSTKQDIYIFAAQNAVIYVDAKCKGVRLDTCKDLILFVDSALSGIEVVNSKKIKVQVVKSVPSFAIDKTDGILVGLSYASRGAQFVTSKSSEMNVTFPEREGDDAEWVEQPIPEQFVTTIQTSGRLATTVSDLYTH